MGVDGVRARLPKRGTSIGLTPLSFCVIFAQALHCTNPAVWCAFLLAIAGWKEITRTIATIGKYQNHARFLHALTLTRLFYAYPNWAAIILDRFHSAR